MSKELSTVKLWPGFGKYLNSFQGLNMIDIGSSGNLDKKWSPYKPQINLIGFDPNEEECKRMSAIDSGCRTTTYIPYAISGITGESTLYKTKSIYCYSLLKPNTEWLNRFSYSSLFDITGQEKISTKRLIDIEELKGFDADIIKTDTQGLELPILSNSGKLLENAFYAETETGFMQNYVGETTYSQIDEFMRSKNFLLFDINVDHRIARKNNLSAFTTGREQILWCEAVWLKDYVAIAKSDVNKVKQLSREKVFKILLICAIQGCIDFGYELAQLFYDFGHLSKEELSSLAIRTNWEIMKAKEKPDDLITLLLRLLPTKHRISIKNSAEKAALKKHLLKF